ncbi:hypothetical protein [Chitinimonas sp.]|uniref:hypothetical protein n=1 Tax=Chitinimonas sp. TaxID=1934313 RepID=UPI0035B3F393
MTVAKVEDWNLCQSLPERVAYCIQRIGGSGKTQRAVGVTNATLQRWRKGEVDIATSHLVALAMAAGVTVQWLATGEGPVNFSDGWDKPRQPIPTDIAYAEVVSREPEAPRRNEPPPLASSHPSQLDHDAMWGCVQSTYLISNGLGLKAADAADLCMRLYAIAMSSGESGYKAANFAVDQFREGINYQ